MAVELSPPADPFKDWRPPTRLNILGHYYRVEFVTAGVLGKKQTGEMSYPARLIRLLKTLKDEELFLTFFHEVRHAQHFESGDTQTMSAKEQEKDCEQYASNLSSLKKQGVL